MLRYASQPDTMQSESLDVKHWRRGRVEVTVVDGFLPSRKVLSRPESCECESLPLPAGIGIAPVMGRGAGG